MEMKTMRAIFKSLETYYCYQIQVLKVQCIKGQPCSQLHELHTCYDWRESTAFFCRLVYLFYRCLHLDLETRIPVQYCIKTKNKKTQHKANNILLFL